MQIRSLVTVVMSFGGLAGCASAPPENHFAAVKQTVAERTGATVRWRTESAEDAEADRNVVQLLTKPLTADIAAQIALLNNRHLQATFEDIGIAQADLVQAGLLKNPVFDLSIRFPNRSPSKTYLDMSIASDFIELFLIPARKKLAGVALRQAELRVTDQVLATVTQAKTDFYRYQAAVQILTLREKVAQAASASSEAARRLQEAGNINQLDALAEEAQGVRARVELNDAQAESAAAREAVNKDLGMTNGADKWRPSDELPELPAGEVSVDGLEAIALRTREDVAAARQEVELQSATLAYGRQTRFLPTLTAGVEAERETEGQWRIGPTFAVPVPLFDQGQGVVARQEAVLRQSRSKYEALCADVRSEVRSASERVKASRRKAALYRDEVRPLQRKLMEQTQLQFNGMYASVFQLLQARREEISAETEYITALRDYWTARTELERATGGGALSVNFPSTRPAASRSATVPSENPVPTTLEHHHHGEMP